MVKFLILNLMPKPKTPYDTRIVLHLKLILQRIVLHLQNICTEMITQSWKLLVWSLCDIFLFYFYFFIDPHTTNHDLLQVLYYMYCTFHCLSVLEKPKLCHSTSMDVVTPCSRYVKQVNKRWKSKMLLEMYHLRQSWTIKEKLNNLSVVRII